MTTFADDVAAVAVELERVAAEAAKRRGVREAQGRELPPAVLAQLERCQAALVPLLEPPAVPRSAAELRAALDALDQPRRQSAVQNWPGEPDAQ
jgi:hypothetical protein